MTHPVPHEVVIFVLLVVLALAVAFVARRLRVTYTLALVLTGLAIGALHLLPTVQLNANLVLFVFLPALLFEGAWNTETAALRADWLAILLLAVPGLIVSLVVVAVVVHWGAGLPLLAALLLGAIVSPTDPIAVLALLRQLGMPERLCAIIEGESLFNDGVGAAAFDLVLGALLLSLHQDNALAGLNGTFVVLKALWLLLGGLVVGGTVGFAVSHVVRVVDDPLLETAVTFSVAYGAYILATALGTSGLLSVVGAGLVLGSYGRRIGMTEPTRAVVDTVWQFTGYLANSLLFLLVGIEIGSSSLFDELPTIAWAVLGVLLARAVVIYTLLPLHDAIKRWRGAHIGGDRPHAFGWLPVPPLWRPLILFSGLRGALSLALVISLPPSVPLRQPLTLAVYGVVLVTLVGQTIGLRLVIPRWPRV